MSWLTLDAGRWIYHGSLGPEAFDWREGKVPNEHLKLGLVRSRRTTGSSHSSQGFLLTNHMAGLKQIRLITRPGEFDLAAEDPVDRGRVGEDHGDAD